MGPCGYGIRPVLSSPRMSVVGVVVVFQSSTEGSRVENSLCSNSRHKHK